jgi:dTDP-4-dehydrorhamnose reductase
MKVWLIGADGMLGSVFPEYFRKNKIQFVSTTYGIIDITNEELVEKFIRDQGISHIVNCAAYTAVDLAEKEKYQAHLINSEALIHLGKAASKNKAWVLHFSTDYAFNGESRDTLDETHHCDPINYYGFTKLEGEKNLLRECQNSCIIRTSWLFGLNGKNFVSTMLRLLKEKEELNVVSDQRGRPTFCNDLVKVSIKLMKLSATGIFHFANEGATSWHGFTEGIYKASIQKGILPDGKLILPVATEDYPTPAKRPLNSVLNTSKLESLIGKGYFRSWEDALVDYLNLYGVTQ